MGYKALIFLPNPHAPRVRITALTGSGLTTFLENRSRIIDQLSEMLKVPAENIPSRVNRLLDDNKKLTKQLKSAARQGGGGRPQMAQAGGKNPQKIPEALEKAAEIIKQKLT